MTSTASTHRIDRIVDALIDRKHPFWQDERQAAVYNEAAAAALVLQGILIPVIGGFGLLVVGRPAVGIVTAMVLSVAAGQWLIFGVLMRRHVHFDTKAWRQGSSMTRRAIGIVVGIFYIGCYLWARFHSFDVTKIDRPTWIAIAVGLMAGIAAMVFAQRAYKQRVKKHEVQDLNQ
jgi:hypothetical protein